MILKMDQYESLRDKFVKVASYHLSQADVNLLKLQYAPVINSNRMLYNIQNIEKLIRTLEQRGVLRYDHIQPLRDISKDYVKDLAIKDALDQYEIQLKSWLYPPGTNLYALPNGEYQWSNDRLPLACSSVSVHSSNPYSPNTETVNGLNNENSINEIVLPFLPYQNNLELLHRHSYNDLNACRDQLSSALTVRDLNIQSRIYNEFISFLSHNGSCIDTSHTPSASSNENNIQLPLEESMPETQISSDETSLLSSKRSSNSTNDLSPGSNDDSASNDRILSRSAIHPLILTNLPIRTTAIDNDYEISDTPPPFRPQRLKPQINESPCQNKMPESAQPIVINNYVQDMYKSRNKSKVFVALIILCIVVLGATLLVEKVLRSNSVSIEAIPTAPSYQEPKPRQPEIWQKPTTSSYPVDQPQYATEIPVRTAPLPLRNREEIIQQRVFNLVSDSLGKYWTDVARFLGLRESVIDEIDVNGKSLKEKGFKALKIFASENDPNYWQRDLKRALVKARRKDLEERVEEWLSRKE